MSKYKPVKIMFDVEDEYQNKLYTHLKNRTNGSSYVRSLIYKDIHGISEPQQYPVFKEQNNSSQQFIQPTNNDVITEWKLPNVDTVETVEEEKIDIDDISIDDLI